MKQILYNSDAAKVRLEYPGGWDATLIDKVTLAITDLGASALLAAATTTIFTKNQLNAAVSAGGTSVTLKTAVAHIPVTGDRFWIPSDSSGRGETIECSYYDATNKIIYLVDDLRYAHAADTYIYSQFATYTMNTTTVATWPKNEQLILYWQPYTNTGTDMIYPAYTERGEVATIAFAPAGVEKSFAIRFPREYEIITAHNLNFNDFYSEAYNEEADKLHSLAGLELDRLVDQAVAKTHIINAIRRIIVTDGGDDMETERLVAQAMYESSWKTLTEAPRWKDEDQDGAESDDEVDDHGAWQMLNSERGI